MVSKTMMIYILKPSTAGSPRFNRFRHLLRERGLHAASQEREKDTYYISVISFLFKS